MAGLCRRTDPADNDTAHNMEIFYWDFLFNSLTRVKATGEVHGLQIVVAALLMFFQRAPLLIASTTISTFVGLAN